jgi:hypothetical protein
MGKAERILTRETMSLAIAIDRVADVLLADGWHKVADRSFDLDAYEYREGADESGEEDVWVVRGVVVAGVPSTGTDNNDQELRFVGYAL